MKKILSTLLTLVFILSLGTIAVAETDSKVGKVDRSTIDVPKKYTPTGGPSTSFTFEISRLDVSDQNKEVNSENMPIPSFNNEKTDSTTTIIFPVGGGESQSATLYLPKYESVGYYRYLITEDASPAVPWVKYDQRKMILTVQVLQVGNELIRNPQIGFGTKQNDEWVRPDKGGQFENGYLAGELSLNKQVTGNLGDQNKYFKFSIQFDAPADFPLDSTIYISEDNSYNNPKNVTFNKNETNVSVDVYLKHNETINFTNIPFGVSYTITEEGTEYTPSYTKKTGDSNIGKPNTGEPNKELSAKGEILEDAEKHEVVFTNNKVAEVDMGISLDNIPYIMILGLAVLGISGLFLRRRKNANF